MSILHRFFDRDAWLEIIQVMVRNPFRTFLSGLGVGWGLFMIIITVGASTGLENGVSAELEGTARNSMFLWTQRTSMPYKGFQRGRGLEMDTSDVAFIREHAKGVVTICPRNQLGGYRGSNNIVRKDKTGAFNVYGDIPEYMLVEPKPILRGRYLNQADLVEERKIAVIGRRVQELLFEPKEDPLGETIQIAGITFMVVGVFGTHQTGEDAEEDTQSIFVPFSTFNRAFHRGDEIGWLSLLIKDGWRADSASAEIIGLLKARKSVHPDDPSAFGHWTMADEVEEIETVFDAFRIISFVFGGLALLAGIIGIVNIMLITIRERTAELGIRRALGATPRTIILQIMAETLFLTVLAGLAGAIVGVAAIEGIDGFLKSMPDNGAFKNPEVTLRTVVQALVTMSIMGALAGVLPAWRAISVRPVDAIRSD